MWNIVGAGFYTASREQLTRVYNDLNIRTLEGYISAAHVRLMVRSLRGKAVVEITERDTDSQYHPDDSEYVWVVVRLEN